MGDRVELGRGVNELDEDNGDGVVWFGIVLIILALILGFAVGRLTA